VTVPLGNPFSLGQTGVQTSARTDRLALGASFRPGASPLSALSGFLYGPPGTMGDLTLLTDLLLRVDPFLAVVQGTHASDQGQYLVPNNASRDLAVPAKDASLFRRALIVVRVADSLAAGVAPSSTTDGAWLEILPGPLVASNPQLPATPANALLAGELSIPSTASGQPVTITKYNPRTTGRGGILPVVAADTTPGGFVGQYRDHPTLGLQRWNGSAWTVDPTGTTVLYAPYFAAIGTVVQTLVADGTEQRISAAAILNATVALSAGRLYRAELSGVVNASAAANHQLNVRARAGGVGTAVQPGSTLVAPGRAYIAAAGTVGRTQIVASGRFTVPADGNYTFAPFMVGASSSLLTDNRGLVDLAIEDAGPATSANAGTPSVGSA
jgi:hypothetical protein